MFVSKLVLRNFRGYNYLSLEFQKGLNIIIGENAQGKTNIVEAIHFLSLAKSFRTNENCDLITKSRQFATIDAWVGQDNITKEITALLTPSIKKVTCNKNPVRKISELSSLINVLLFEPKDTFLFSGSPIARRNFIDVSISKKSPIYLDNLIVYERLLKERNAILKRDTIDKIQLEVITKRIVDASETIANYRNVYINEINRILSRIVAKLSNEKSDVILCYHPFVVPDKDYKKNDLKAYEKSLESDIKHKATQIGIHREDISMLLNGKDIATHGSRGENRICVLALKLAPYFLIDDKEARPIVVLDDAMSELDKAHQQSLLEFLSNFEQVFITTTHLEIKNASIYEVKEHTVTRRHA